MPRYKLRLTDGKRVISDESWWSELPNDESATQEAYRVADDLSDAPDEDWRDWAVEMQDETGRLVISIRTTSVQSANSHEIESSG